MSERMAIAGVHRPLTPIEIAEDLESGLNSYGTCSLAARTIRQQHAELERLKRECSHIYDLLARIHHDGGQYAAEHGVEKACDDAEAQVVTWLETINNVDSLIEQARLAEREACAAVCEKSSFPAFTAKCFAADIRARAKP